jgi:hypothetical protein
LETRKKRDKNALVRVDYQRISDEMYESREERQPPSRHTLIIGMVLIIVLPIGTILYFLIALLSFAHQLRGF